MINFVSGDFFDYDADIRINTVNCVGIMGAGVALLFKNKFPEMFDDYVRSCKRGEVKPGKPHVWETVDLLSKCTIINFPTKIHWKNPSEYEYVEKGLIWLEQFLSDKKDSVVTLPALGCGHGGLDWEIVKQMIIDHLDKIESTILVFEPKSLTNKPESETIKRKLLEHNICKISPNDDFYPSVLKGRSALEFYYKGNIELLKVKQINILANSKSTEREKTSILKLVDELPRDKFVFVLGISGSYESELAKEVLNRGFKVIFLISCGILQLNIRSDLKDLWDYNNILVLSTTNPIQTWKKYESINSLKLRLKISSITIINSMNLENINRLSKDFIHSESKYFYLNYWTVPIDIFKIIKANKIGISSKTSKPNITPILEELNIRPSS